MTVGAQLQQARITQQHSLAAASQATKIQPWVLEALEGDRLQEQMSQIYVQGFLKMYAAFLRLDADGLLTQFPWPQPPAEHAEEVLAAPEVSPVAFSWQPIMELLKRLRPAAAVAGIIAMVVIVKPMRWLPAIRLPHREASIVVASELVAKPVALPKPVTVVKPEPVEPPQLPPKVARPLELVITVQRATWISVRADGKLLTQQRLPRGAKELWTAKKRLEVVVAKPLQVDVSLNGQSISPFVVTHQGRVLITQEGVSSLPDRGL